MKRWSIN